MKHKYKEKDKKVICLHTVLNVEKRLMEQSTQLQDVSTHINEAKKERERLIQTLEQKKQSFMENNNNKKELIEAEHLYKIVLSMINDMKKSNKKKAEEIISKDRAIKRYKQETNRLQQNMEVSRRQIYQQNKSITYLKGVLQHKEQLLHSYQTTRKHIFKKLKQKDRQIKYYKNGEINCLKKKKVIEEQRKKNEKLKNEEGKAKQELKTRKNNDVVLTKMTEIYEEVNQRQSEEFQFMQQKLEQATIQLEKMEKFLWSRTELTKKNDKGRWMALWNIWNNDKELEYQEKVKEIGKEIQGLKREFQTNKMKMEQWQTDINGEYENRLRELTEVIKEYTETIADYSNKEDDIQQYKEKEEDYKRKMEELVSKYQKLEDKFQVMEKELNQYKEELTHHKNKNERLKEQLKKHETGSKEEGLQIKQLNERIKNYENQNNKLKKALKEKDKQVKSFQQSSSHEQTMDLPNIFQRPNTSDYNVPLPSQSQTTVFNPFKYSK